jgi:hypothetical protein
LAGFVFGGIVVVLSVRVASRSEEAARALKLLFCAFFGLAVAAYLLADQAGDTNCLRAASEETLSGGILGTFAIVMMVALTWLVVAYELHSHGVLRFLRGLIYFASAFVVLLLCTSSYSYLQAEVPDGPPQVMMILIYLTGGLLYLIAVPVGSHIVTFRPARVTRIAASMNHESDPVAGTHQAKRSAVDRCAWAALGYLAAAAIGDAFVLTMSDSVWARPQLPAAYVVAWSSLLLPLGVLVLAMRALALDRAATSDARPESAYTPSDHRKGPALTADVDQNLLRQRFETYSVDHYTGLHNTVVSVVLAVAGLSAASLAGSHAQYGRSYPLLWMLWAASLLLCAAIFAGTMSGSVAMPPLMPTITDLLVPLLLGVGEFLLFGVLAHQITGLNRPSSVAEAWFISLAVVCLCAAAAITRAMRFFRGATYATEITQPIDDYRFRRLPADRKGALVTAIIGIGGAMASAAEISWLEYVLGACAIAGLLLALHGHARSAALMRIAMRQGRSAYVTDSSPSGLPQADGDQAVT